MVTALVEARVDGARLSDDEIVSTVIVLLAGTLRTRTIDALRV